METNICYKYCYSVCVIILCLSALSCKKDSLDIPISNPEEPSNPEVIEKELQGATIEWGLSRDKIISYMDGYDQVRGTGSDMLQFTTSKSKQSISYQLHNGLLIATVVMIPVTSSEIDLQSMLLGFTYVGELSGSKIYENVEKNTMAAICQPANIDSTYDAICFAPISSDAYEKVEPITVTISKDAEPETLSCTLYGNVSGIDKEVEVGFIYSSQATPSESIGKNVKTSSTGNFSLTLKGILDDQTYYYRAYAIVDDIYYLSDVKEFTTDQLTYELDGVTFKFVKVEGGDMPPFSIMETEYPCVGSHTVKINGFDFLSIDGGYGNDNGIVEETEFRSFWYRIKSSLGLPIRLPHRTEWVYAAQGGAKSHGYLYSGSDEIDNVAWYKGNSDGGSHPVAKKMPNELGLYDMSGNYAELCFFEGNLNGTSVDTTDINGPCCGGSWKNAAGDCKVTSWEEGKTSGYISGTKLHEKYGFDSSYIGLRFVYSREEK